MLNQLVAWFRRRTLVQEAQPTWEEPSPPPWLRVNPDADVGVVPEGPQPGDISMRQVVEDFLEEPEPEVAPEPEPGDEER